MKRIAMVLAAIGLSVVSPIAERPARALSCASGPFIIFFDEGIASASGEAIKILENAVAAWGNCGVSNVEIAGHTDFNEAPSLAVDRAKTVRAFFAARGISVSQISVVGLGSRIPRRANVSGKVERENRRVEISFVPAKRRIRG